MRALQWRIQGVFWLPGNPPPAMIFLNQGLTPLTGTGLHQPLKFATFGPPPLETNSGYATALEGMPGIKVGGYNMNNIIYADDKVLIADNDNELQEMLDTVVRESEKKGISLNKKKTEVMVISKKNCKLICNIVMNGTVLKQVHKCNYL